MAIVAGRLLAEKPVLPELLDRDEDFRYTVLNRFQDVLLGQIGEHADQAACRSLLQVVSAMAPLPIINRTLPDHDIIPGT